MCAVLATSVRDEIAASVPDSKFAPEVQRRIADWTSVCDRRLTPISNGRLAVQERQAATDGSVGGTGRGGRAAGVTCFGGRAPGVCAGAALDGPRLLRRADGGLAVARPGGAAVVWARRRRRRRRVSGTTRAGAAAGGVASGAASRSRRSRLDCLEVLGLLLDGAQGQPVHQRGDIDRSRLGVAAVPRSSTKTAGRCTVGGLSGPSTPPADRDRRRRDRDRQRSLLPRAPPAPPS